MISKPKVFEVDFRNRSFRDTISGILPTITGTPEFKRGDKGYGLGGNILSYLQYAKTITNGTYSVVIWAAHTHSQAGFVDFRTALGGTGVIWIAGDFVYNTGATPYVNNVNSTTAKLNIINCLFSTNMTINSTQITLNALWSGAAPNTNGNMAYFAIYEGTLTSAERTELYQDFLDAPSAINSPTVIRPIHEVDPTGTILCYDFQRWNGGSVVTDLSPSGNHGTRVGFVDKTAGGAKFLRTADGATIGQTHFTCGNGGGISGNLSIEALIDKDAVTGQEVIINKGSSALAGINYCLGFTAPNSIRFILSNGVTSQDYSIAITQPILNKNIHLVATADGTNLRIYYNGENIKTIAQTVIPVSNLYTIIVGGLTPSYYKFDGTIKFLKVYNSALTPEQVKEKYNKIASQVDLNVLGSNLLPDSVTKTAGMRLNI